MSLINKLVLKIYDNQLKDVIKRQKDLTLTDEVIIKENIQYVEGNDNLYTYDYIYKKESDKLNELPLIINIHGGAFTGGDKSINKYYASFLALNNYQVATINYHYAPLGNLKRQVQDSVLAIEKITKEYNINKIYLTGDSSGSVLVLLISLLWNNKRMQEVYQVSPPNIEILALGLNCTQASIDMFPSFMKAFNKENRRIILSSCEEIEEYTNIKELWNDNMPPVYIISAEEDVCYQNCKDFDSWLTKINHPHSSYYCKKKEEGKLFHCFNVVRPDLECSKKANEAMLEYFSSYR